MIDKATYTVTPHEINSAIHKLCKNVSMQYPLSAKVTFDASLVFACKPRSDRTLQLDPIRLSFNTSFVYDRAGCAVVNPFIIKGQPLNIYSKPITVTKFSGYGIFTFSMTGRDFHNLQVLSDGVFFNYVYNSKLESMIDTKVESESEIHYV